MSRFKKMFAPIPIWLLQRGEVNELCKVLYARLLLHAGHDGRCFPSVDTLAEELAKHRTAIYKALKTLEDHKLITREQRVGRTNVYGFPDHIWEEDENPSDCKETSCTKRCSTSAIGGVAEPLHVKEVLKDKDLLAPPSEDPEPVRKEKPWSVVVAWQNGYEQRVGVRPPITNRGAAGKIAKNLIAEVGFDLALKLANRFGANPPTNNPTYQDFRFIGGACAEMLARMKEEERWS